MNNTALVVGATGIVGSALIRELQGADWAVHGLARSPAALPAGVGAVAAGSGARAQPDSSRDNTARAGNRRMTGGNGVFGGSTIAEDDAEAATTTATRT